MENLISSKIFENQINVKKIETNEENINDLLELSNEELLKNSTIINNVYIFILI